MSGRKPAGLPTRRAVLRGFTAVAAGTLTGVGSYGYFHERLALRLTEASLPVSGLPEALAGLRIGLLTDLHRSVSVPDQFARAAARLLSDQRPDLIVLGGDYVSNADRRFMEPAADVLADLTAPEGVFAILGNHDDEREMPAALVRRGIPVLQDARTRLTIRRSVLELVGLSFWTRRVQDLSHLLRGASGTPVLLAHDPRRLVEAAALDVPLVLSGHTHGGQIVLPLIGAPAARRFPVVAGVARRENTTIFVSRGVGTVYLPVRFNCPPEVAVLTLIRHGEI